ncbi:MAG: PD-(D/E)XK nuclease family protein [Candidatus Micrarchaeia archaeon]
MPWKLSPSSLALYNECPRCFWLHLVKKVKRPTPIFPSLPSGIDALLKRYFDSYAIRNSLPPELNPLKDKYSLFSDIETLRSWRAPNGGLSWTDADGNVLRGAVDNILVRKDDDRLVVLDYKTMGFERENTYEKMAQYYQDQISIYTFLLQKQGYKTENYAYLLFYSPHSVQSDGKIVFKTYIVKCNVVPEDGLKLFKSAIKILNGAMPDSSEDCEFCRWASEYKHAVSSSI